MVEHQPDLSRVFRALGDATRRGMLEQLRDGERSITDLAAPFDMSFAAAAKHVKTLENARLVRRRWQGRVAFVSLDPRALREADAFLERYRGFWSARLDALDRYFRDQNKERKR